MRVSSSRLKQGPIPIPIPWPRPLALVGLGVILVVASLAAGGCRRRASPAASERPEGLAWASWPMPNPASVGLPNPASYDTSSAEVVLDNVTGLAWQKGTAPDALLWKDASGYCRDLVLGGNDDWRLPALVELVSLIDFTRQVPALDPSAFPDTTGANFWSATPLAGSAGTEEWYLAFSTGFTYHGHGEMLSLRARCVRTARVSSAAGTTPHYTFPKEGTVLDTRTGLTWQRSVGPSFSSASYDWAEAGAACRALALDGAGWRLPSVKELQTLLDLTRQNPALDPEAFPGAPSNEFWTSTPVTGSTSDAWYVNFWFGITNTLARSSTTWARCVR